MAAVPGELISQENRELAVQPSGGRTPDLDSATLRLCFQPFDHIDPSPFPNRVVQIIIRSRGYDMMSQYAYSTIRRRPYTPPQTSSHSVVMARHLPPNCVGEDGETVSGTASAAHGEVISTDSLDVDSEYSRIPVRYITSYALHTIPSAVGRS